MPIVNPDGFDTPDNPILVQLAASSGATLIGWIYAFSGAVAATVQNWISWQPLNAFGFMTVSQIADVQAGTALLDLATPLQAFKTALVSGAQKRRGVFPSGRYSASVFPNFAVSNLEIEAQGEVRLKYTGTGIGIDLDGGAAGTGVFNCKFGVAGRFIIEVPSTATHAVRARAFHHGSVRVKVLGAGTTSAAFISQWAVCSVFDIVSSVNEEGWIAKPQYGIYLDRRGAGENTSYCTFINPICEGNDTGIYLSFTLGNNFYGGTAEACTLYGVYCSVNANQDKINGLDMENNTTADIYCQGKSIKFIDCDTTLLLDIGTGAGHCAIIGGLHKQITIDAGANDTVYSRTQFNRGNTGATISNGGTNSKSDGMNLNIGTSVFS